MTQRKRNNEPAPGFLAFDLGASNARAILGTLHTDRLEMQTVHRFETPMVQKNGHLYWDVEEMWSGMKKGFREAKKMSGHLHSLSVSSWGVDYVPLDQNGKALRLPYSYRDDRSYSITGEVHRLIPESEFYRITGIKSMPINTLYQIYWDLKHEPERFKKTACRLTIADYFNYLFSHRRVIEKSLASTTQMLEVRTGKWAEGLLESLGLSANTLPPVVASATILGRVVDSPSVKVIASCSHDTACAVATISALSENRNRALVSSGTWSLIGMEKSAPILSEEAFQAGFTNESGPGKSVRFLKNMTGLWVLQQCRRNWRESGEDASYETLLREAEESAKLESPVCIPLDHPSFALSGDMVSKLQRYCAEQNLPVPGSRGNTVAMILRSLAKAYSDTIRTLEKITQEPVSTLHIVGGGSQNDLLCRWTAELSGCELLAGPAEASAIGNILLQAKALNLLPRRDELRVLLRESELVRVYPPSRPQDP